MNVNKIEISWDPNSKDVQMKSASGANVFLVMSALQAQLESLKKMVFEILDSEKLTDPNEREQRVKSLTIEDLKDLSATGFSKLIIT